MNARLNRRTATAALATLAIGVLLTATAATTWAAPAQTTAAGSTSTAAASTASATPSPSPTSSTEAGQRVVVENGTVTLTLDAAKVQKLCAKTPGATKRIDDLIARIQGSTEVKGSSASITKRAEAARAAGRSAAADRLDERATRRGDRVADLQRAAERITAIEDAVCVPLAEQLGTTS